MRKNRLAPQTEERLAAELKQEVLARFASIHAFCKAHSELSRGTVYQTLSGKYSGDFINQSARIRAALTAIEEIDEPVAIRPMEAGELVEILQEIRCRHCRRLNRRECMACRDQTGREAVELHEKIYHAKGESEEEQ